MTTEPVHPGEVLRKLLFERGLRQKDLVDATGLTTHHLNQIVMGHVGLTPKTALLLEESLETPPAEFWCNLQTNYSLALLRNATRA